MPARNFWSRKHWQRVDSGRSGRRRATTGVGSVLGEGGGNRMDTRRPMGELRRGTKEGGQGKAENDEKPKAGEEGKDARWIVLRVLVGPIP